MADTLTAEEREALDWTAKALKRWELNGDRAWVSIPLRHLRVLARLSTPELLQLGEAAVKESAAADAYNQDRSIRNWCTLNNAQDSIMSASRAYAASREGPYHASDCAVHNEPALTKGPCDCGVEGRDHE